MKQGRRMGSPRTGRELPFVIGTQNEACRAPGTRASDAFGEHVGKNQGRRQAKSSEIKNRASSGTGSLPPAIHPAARVAVWLSATPKARFLPPETHRAAELSGHARERTQLEALTLGFSQAPAPRDQDSVLHWVGPVIWEEEGCRGLSETTLLAIIEREAGGVETRERGRLSELPEQEERGQNLPNLGVDSKSPVGGSDAPHFLSCRPNHWIGG